MPDRPTRVVSGAADNHASGAGAGQGESSVGPVELSFPVGDDLLVVARLTVSTVASRAGFDIEQVEDLRLAVDELCLLVVGGRRLGRIVLAMDAGPARIDVWCHYEGADAMPSDGNDDVDLSARILDALVDEHGADTRNGRAGEYLCLRRSPVDERPR